MYSKLNQLSKTKKDNPKRMSKAEYRRKCDWLFTKHPICQVCLVSSSQDAHHTKYSYNKDDRSIIAICRECHNAVHHSTIGLEELLGVTRQDLEALGEQNHKEWESENNI